MQYDAVVIGAGPGGYIAAVHLRQLGLKVACIEREEHLGGTCLNIGCIPSKALLHASEHFAHFKQQAPMHGISVQDSDFNFSNMMKRKNDVVDGLTVGVSDLFQKNHVDLIAGFAKIVDPHTLVVTGSDGSEKIVTATSIVLATGSRPVPLPFLRFDEKKVISSTGALHLETLPQKMIVVGGGVLGVEMASVYARLGTNVCVVEQLPHICSEIDKTITTMLTHTLEKQNISFLLNTQVLTARDLGKKGIELGLRASSGQEKSIVADCVLVAVGRHPNSENLGLSQLQVDVSGRGKVIVDDRFRTTVPNIYAIGDLIEGPSLAHRASYEGACVAEIIAGKPCRFSYTAIPNIVYTSPEVASVGLSEEAAKELERPLKIGTCHFKSNARARITGQTDGKVKVIADKQTDRILGIHILSAHASEMIGIAVIALSKRFTLSDLGDLPFAHPTLSEAIKEACLDALGRSYH